VPSAEGQVPRLFGTDGIRGTAGHYPLDPATVRRIGAALVRASESGTPRLLVGRDTRESGGWIEAELGHGATGEGAVVVSAGVVPTPAVAYLTRHDGYDAGVVISASHNPFEDNGIKVFSGRGEKFTERVERHIEQIVADGTWQARGGQPRAVTHLDLTAGYLEHLLTVAPDPESIRGLRLVVDCANGATTTAAPELFRRAGASATFIGNKPDGRNINLGCGSTAPEELARTVVAERADLGVAFDGDGDRAMFVDGQGRLVNGDSVLLMCARQLQREGRLRGSAVVATVMSNIGLERALRETGISIVRCPVGDRHVMEAMLAGGLSLGGEQSGHVIFADYLFTGDGLCTALQVLRVMAHTGRSLADLAADLVNYPQLLLNVRVRQKTDLATIPAIVKAIEDVEASLAGKGRLLVRYSGTEPLLRVMLEGEREDEIRRWGNEIVDKVTEYLG
jgi:phosphoglucosamine mutase